jgi:hypothetical protein
VARHTKLKFTDTPPKPHKYVPISCDNSPVPVLTEPDMIDRLEKGIICLKKIGMYRELDLDFETHN